MRRKKKKILFILNVDYFLLSHRLPIAIEAIKKGYEVHLAAQTTNASKEIKKHNIKVHSIRISRSSIKLNEIFITLIDIFKIVKKINPDIIHLISIKPVLLGGLILHFIRSRAKIIISISGLGFVFSNKDFKTSIIKFLSNLLYKIAFKHKKMICIVQNKDDFFFLRKLTSLPESNYKLIAGSGVDLEKFSISKVNNNNKPIILFPARLVISKGIVNFLEASIALKNEARFVIVGKYDKDSRDGLNEKDLELYINKNYIEYWGYSENMHLVIPKSTIVVLPSFREGLPKVLCEAAACGKPVITTNVPGCREAIIEKETGLLIPKDDTAALVKALKSLLNNPKYLVQMGQKGRELAESKFNIRHIVKRHMEIYGIE